MLPDSQAGRDGEEGRGRDGGERWKSENIQRENGRLKIELRLPHIENANPSFNKTKKKDR